MSHLLRIQNPPVPRLNSSRSLGNNGYQYVCFGSNAACCEIHDRRAISSRSPVRCFAFPPLCRRAPCPARILGLRIRGAIPREQNSARRSCGCCACPGSRARGCATSHVPCPSASLRRNLCRGCGFSRWVSRDCGIVAVRGLGCVSVVFFFLCHVISSDLIDKPRQIPLITFNVITCLPLLEP